MSREDISRIIDLLYDANRAIRKEKEETNYWGFSSEEIKNKQIDYIIEHF